MGSFTTFFWKMFPKELAIMLSTLMVGAGIGGVVGISTAVPTGAAIQGLFSLSKTGWPESKASREALVGAHNTNAKGFWSLLRRPG